MEVTLLRNGVPYEALYYADDSEVVGWFACLDEQQKDVINALGNVR